MMPCSFRSFVCLCVFSATGFAGALPSVAAAQSAAEIDYNRAIRPILSNHCFQCHGPDANQRQAGLRLDERDAAMQPADSG